MTLWNTRDKAIQELGGLLKDEAEVLCQAFSLLDDCIARLESEHSSEAFSRVCALTLIKARNLLLGSYSLSIDGLAQEAGALLRPFIEAFEQMVYFNEDPNEYPKCDIPGSLGFAHFVSSYPATQLKSRFRNCQGIHPYPQSMTKHRR
jgi:hypothetical protein